MVAELPTVTGVLDSAKGTARVGGDHAVDEGQSGFDLIKDFAYTGPYEDITIKGT